MTMTIQEATAWVRSLHEDGEVDHDTLVEAFRAVYERKPDDNDGDDGEVFSVLCAGLPDEDDEESEYSHDEDWALATCTTCGATDYAHTSWWSHHCGGTMVPAEQAYKITDVNGRWAVVGAMSMADVIDYVRYLADENVEDGAYRGLVHITAPDGAESTIIKGERQ